MSLTELRFAAQLPRPRAEFFVGNHLFRLQIKIENASICDSVWRKVVGKEFDDRPLVPGSVDGHETSLGFVTIFDERNLPLSVPDEIR